ncbi:unnamed protein product [Periconia digitata]|uniref:Methyltransferase domain-containing protein n=1 Tax=Periconia digitata TaxID=1303443 RepID=A0A9W4UDA7_9PLEO|nr:unnamed protein product [Periconia digitata]
MSAPFIPKQVLPFDPRFLLKLNVGISRSLADQVVSKVVPTLPPKSRIHDNACGPGDVTKALLEAGKLTDGTTIDATDINSAYLDELEDAIKDNKASSVTVEVMDSMALTYPDNTFTLSIASLVLPYVKEDVAVARELLRTLEPGGTGVITVWKDSPMINVTIDAHHQTRGKEAPLPPLVALSLYSVDELKKALDGAGYGNVSYVDMTAYADMDDIKEWATIAWSFLAQPSGGWTKADEDSWDTAISIMVDGLSSAGSKDEQSKITMVPMTGTAAVFKK